MKLTIMLLVLYSQLILTPYLYAQKLIPHSFSLTQNANEEPSLQLITEINEPSSSFVRLYLKGTQLGNESYLLLESAEGAKQKLRKRDLENWNYSSAYFNGSTVKVFLFTAKGEQNNVSINAIKTDDSKSNTIRATAARSTNSIPEDQNWTGAIDYEETPYAAAVGRFTNGSKAFGTGWIAPNGAIVTSRMAGSRMHHGYDVIEFNVPLSTSYGHVDHPAPEDQYPINPARPYELATETITYDFKGKYNWATQNEDNYGDFHSGWAVLEALPNETGLRPGERQQQYFKIAPNIGSFALEAMNGLEIDIFHYGETLYDLIHEENYRTLKKYVTTAVPSETYLDWATSDRDEVLLYNLGAGDITASDSDSGAPITFHGHNIAIGVHSDFYTWPPAGGIGFSHQPFISELHHYFSNNFTYVDQSSLWESPTGAVDKPFLQLSDGISHAADGGIINIAKGEYGESFTISKAVTLKAPVGKVVVGVTGAAVARMATLPPGVAEGGKYVMENIQMEDNGPVGVDITPYPNPFTTDTNISYALSEAELVQLTVFDHAGNKVKSLVYETKLKGNHAIKWDGNDYSGRPVTPGLYVIRLESGSEAKSVKVLKR